MNGVIFRTDNTREFVDIPEGTTLHFAQGVVDGWVDVVDLNSPTAGIMSMYVNDEGLLLDLPINTMGTLLNEEGGSGSPIAGDVLILGGVDDEGNTLGLSDEQVFLLLNVRVLDGLTGERVL